MQRFWVVLLAAVDAAVAAAVGLGALFAPLAVLWVVMFGVEGDGGALWSTAATLWQFGHGVPLDVVLSEEIVRAIGVAPEAAEFSLSLPPLAILLFTLLFAVRSGRRAVRAGAWLSGVTSGVVVFSAITALVAVTSTSELARVPTWAAFVLPALTYAVGIIVGALTLAWGIGDGGIVDRVHDRFDALGAWAHVPEYALRGGAAAFMTLVGAAAVTVTVAVVGRAGEMIALFEGLRADALGIVLLGSAQLLVVPTLIGWAIAWLAGPGIAVGLGSTVSPVATHAAVVPGIPVFGIIPEGGSPWLLIVVLVPVGAGALAGWIVRSRMISSGEDATFAQRMVVTAGIAVFAAGAASAAAALTSGSIGPGRLSVVGPEPGLIALAVGLEVLVGAAILLLSPSESDDLDDDDDGVEHDLVFVGDARALQQALSARAGKGHPDAASHDSDPSRFAPPATTESEE